jgi:hypothetical protein
MLRASRLKSRIAFLANWAYPGTIDAMWAWMAGRAKTSINEAPGPDKN